MNNVNKRYIFLFSSLIFFAGLVYFLFIPSFETQEFDKAIVQEIADGVTTTTLLNSTQSEQNEQIENTEIFENITEEELSEIEQLLVNNTLNTKSGIEAYLLIGSDERNENSSASRGFVEGSRSDVILLGIVNLENKQNFLISIPRDTLIINSCTKKIERINASFQNNDCGNKAENLAAAIYNLTGIEVVNFASFNFEGFEKIIDGFSGVEICVDKTQREGYSFELQKGCQIVSGSTALNWVVSRHTEVLVGEKIVDSNGEDISTWEPMPGVSDLTRVQRQQYVTTQLLKEVKNFQSINELFKFIQALEDTFVIDETLSLNKAVNLLWDLRNIDINSIKKLTLPTKPYVLDDGRQVLILSKGFDEFAKENSIGN